MRRVIANAYRAHGGRFAGSIVPVYPRGGMEGGSVPEELENCRWGRIFGGVRGGLVPLCGLESVLKLITIRRLRGSLGYEICYRCRVCAYRVRKFYS